MLLQQQVRSNSDFHSAVSFGWLSILQWRLLREELKSKSHLRTLFWRYILHISKKIKPKDHFKLYSLKFVHCMSSLHHFFSSLCFQFCKCCLEKHLKSHYKFFFNCVRQPREAYLWGGLQIMSKLTETYEIYRSPWYKKQKPSSKPSKGKINLHWHPFNSFICLIISACYNTCHYSLI